jgi:hypothetical protein
LQIFNLKDPIYNIKGKIILKEKKDKKKQKKENKKIIGNLNN